MSNQRSEGKDESSNLISSKGRNYSAEGSDRSAFLSAERTKDKIQEIKSQIKDEAAKMKSNLINVISNKPLHRSFNQKKEEVLVNPTLKSNIVRFSDKYRLIIGLALKN